MLRTIALLSCIALLAGCGGGGVGTEKWCEEKKAQPKSEWSMDDAKNYTKNCVVDSTTIGSEEWCAKMKDKGADDLTVEEAKDLAKHCIL